jgi:hypothetical protein
MIDQDLFHKRKEIKKFCGVIEIYLMQNKWLKEVYVFITRQIV